MTPRFLYHTLFDKKSQDDFLHKYYPDFTLFFSKVLHSQIEKTLSDTKKAAYAAFL